jgi:hypothetical protein
MKRFSLTAHKLTPLVFPSSTVPTKHFISGIEASREQSRVKPDLLSPLEPKDPALEVPMSLFREHMPSAAAASMRPFPFRLHI